MPTPLTLLADKGPIMMPGTAHLRGGCSGCLRSMRVILGEEVSPAQQTPYAQSGSLKASRGGPVRGAKCGQGRVIAGLKGPLGGLCCGYSVHVPPAAQQGREEENGEVWLQNNGLGPTSHLHSCLMQGASGTAL